MSCVCKLGFLRIDTVKNQMITDISSFNSIFIFQYCSLKPRNPYAIMNDINFPY